MPDTRNGFSRWARQNDVPPPRLMSALRPKWAHTQLDRHDATVTASVFFADEGMSKNCHYTTFRPHAEAVVVERYFPSAQIGGKM